MESSDFASHITPLMLACINNNYSIIRLLLEKRCKLKEISTIDRSGNKSAYIWIEFRSLCVRTEYSIL